MKVSGENLMKIWVIQNADGVRGGVCFSKNGLILTSNTSLTNTNLRGRYLTSNTSFDLRIVKVKSNFNLAILKVVNSTTTFDFFTLRDSVDVSRGDMLHAIVHSDRVPFSSISGYSSRPFLNELVTFPSINSEDELCDGDINSRYYVWSSPVSYLSVRHILDVVVREGGGDYDDYDNMVVGNSDKDDDKDDVVMDGFDMDSDDHDNDGDDEDNDGDVNDDEDDHVHLLDILHPDIPVIQAMGLGVWDGCSGCPIFNDMGLLVGLYFFHRTRFQYVIPLSFLHMFVSRINTSIRRREKSRKSKRITKLVEMGMGSRRASILMRRPMKGQKSVGSPKTPQPQASSNRSQSMQRALLRDQSNKELAVQIAKDPSFNQIAAPLHKSFHGADCLDGTLMQDQSNKELAEKIAKDPSFNQIAKPLHKSFHGSDCLDGTLMLVLKKAGAEKDEEGY